MAGKLILLSMECMYSRHVYGCIIIMLIQQLHKDVLWLCSKSYSFDTQLRDLAGEGKVQSSSSNAMVMT